MKLLVSDIIKLLYDNLDINTVHILGNLLGSVSDPDWKVSVDGWSDGRLFCLTADPAWTDRPPDGARLDPMRIIITEFQEMSWAEQKKSNFS